MSKGRHPIRAKGRVYEQALRFTRMADPKPSIIQIDDDWKKQAQEEKRRLAEAAQKKAAPTPPAAAPAAPAAAAIPGAVPGADDDEGTPFDQLVQSTLTQALLYLGLLRPGGQRMTDYAAAERQLDTLNVLKDKTRGNLTEEEAAHLDLALHEARSRYVAVVSQSII